MATKIEHVISTWQKNFFNLEAKCQSMKKLLLDKDVIICKCGIILHISPSFRDFWDVSRFWHIIELHSTNFHFLHNLWAITGTFDMTKTPMWKSTLDENHTILALWYYLHEAVSLPSLAEKLKFKLWKAFIGSDQIPFDLIIHKLEVAPSSVVSGIEDTFFSFQTWQII